MGAFWSSWELWEKLCFVLASGIVIVLILGSIKLSYNTWRIRKYAKIRADTLALKKELSHSASVKRGRAKQVPFGIRALEKGVQVEGVWHSRTNTPTPSQPSSPNLIPGEQMIHTPAAKASVGSTVSVPDRKTSVVPATASTDPVSKDFLLPSSALATSKPPSIRQSYKPRRSSGLRFSNAQDDLSPDISFNSRGPSPQSQRQSRNPSPESSSPASMSPVNTPPNPITGIYSLPQAATSSESNPFLTPTATRKSFDADIEHIPLHQLSNLIPGDVGLMGHSAYHTQILQAAHMPYQNNHARPPVSEPDPVHPTQEPHQLHRAAAFSFEDLHDPNPRHFDHDASIFHAAPEYQTPGPHSAKSSITTIVPVSKPIEQQTSISEPNATAGASSRPPSFAPPTGTSRPASITQPTQTSRPPFFTAEKRNSNVIRKINSGFEILRPGTLDMSVRKSGEWLGDREGKKEKRGRLVKKKGRDSLV